MTTSSLRPEAIYDVGLKEVARIRCEMEVVKKQVGFSGVLNDFLNGLNDDPALMPFTTEREAIDYMKAIDSKVKPKLAALFGRAPKAPMEIRPVDPLPRETASSH